MGAIVVGDAVSTLCNELSQQHLAYIHPREMQALLNRLGLVLAGGSRQAATAHLELIEKLSREVS